VKSGELAQALNALEERPWATLRDGRGLSTHGLARHLLLFDIRPEQHRDTAGNIVRGWWRSTLQPTWTRYLDDSTNHPPEGARAADSPTPPNETGTTGTGTDSCLNQAQSPQSPTGTRNQSVPVCEAGEVGSTEPVVPVVPVQPGKEGEHLDRIA